jgi:hypothetical protein
MAAIAPVMGRNKPNDRHRASIRVDSGLNVNFMTYAPSLK